MCMRAQNAQVTYTHRTVAPYIKYHKAGQVPMDMPEEIKTHSCRTNCELAHCYVQLATCHMTCTQHHCYIHDTYTCTNLTVPFYTTNHSNIYVKLCSHIKRFEMISHDMLGLADVAWLAAIQQQAELLAHLLMLCSSVSGVGSKEESVQVTACCLTCCLPSLQQPPCHLQQAREQALQCALHETHAMCSAM